MPRRGNGWNTTSPDLAVLDIMIKDGASLDVAPELKRRGIPLAFYSSLPPKAGRPPELRDAPWLEKPVSRETPAQALYRLLEPAPRPS
ncbi:hypothetical protein AA309_08955 [Microvirga vignae]|uniref:Response regulatory domain-containing protein n=1 Tax=Microvirga vignae TaxID=1225564 RepID=A0A0H1REE2_9HYPH|nr:hypothetical protein [Microvirga vignae]KLK93439.1 hypothetical protein AA309_08955 [Microvirga vignae]